MVAHKSRASDEIVVQLHLNGFSFKIARFSLNIFIYPTHIPPWNADCNGKLFLDSQTEKITSENLFRINSNKTGSM